MSKRGIIITIIIIVLIVIIVEIITSNKDNITYAVGDTLVETVISQNQGTKWSIGASGVYNTIYTKEDGTTIGSDYRYIGASVNNYVSFNNDLYQIIGVFDENTHGKTGQQLVKIIRAKIIGSYSWGVINDVKKDGSYNSYYNDWTGKQYTTPANVNILLNEYFYNKTSSSDTFGKCSNWTYFNTGNDSKTSFCSMIVGYGLEERIRDYIETVVWYLNGYSDSGLTSNNFYLCERGMYTDCTSSNNGGGDASTSVKTGLQYVSDYMYAGGYKTNDSTLTGSSSYNGSQNWLFKGPEWVITPVYSSSRTLFAIDALGQISYTNDSSQSKAIRPTFYLKEDVYVTGGNGSFDDPYTIACDTCNE